MTHFYCENYWQSMKKHYLCNVFFMVLDLRLTKIDCRDDNHFFFYTYLIS